MATNTTDSITAVIFQRLFLNPLGLDKDNSLVLWLALIFAGVIFGGMYITEVNMPVVVFMAYMTGVIILSFLRIDFSLYLFMASVLFLDQYPIPSFPAITEDFGFFSNLKEIDYLPFFEAGMVSPAEIHLLLLLVSLIMHAVLRLNLVLKPIPVFVPFLGFFGALTFGVAYGMMGGGDFMVSLWEVRALFYLCIIFIMVLA